MNKFFGTLETIKDRLRPDGTIECGVQYAGAHTLRWSGESGLNFQNFRKVPIYLDDRRMPTEDPEKAKHALDIRSLLIPRPGKKMISSDLSQIEPRVLAWMAGNKAFLEQVREGMAVYEAYARNSPVMKWRGGDLKKEDPALYARAKVEVLGLGYGAGAVKYIEMARTMGGYNVTDEEAVEHVTNFRKGNPGIVKLWERLDNSFKASCGGTFEMELPSGRGMRYYKVRREPRMYRGKDGKAQRKIVFTADIGGKHKPLYGGLLTENLVQATARDVFAEHLLELSRTAGIKLLFSVHDEAVLEVDEGVTAKDVEDIMSKTPEWIPGCPIAAEASEIPHYTKS
jgi:DNA polymerase